MPSRSRTSASSRPRPRTALARQAAAQAAARIAPAADARGPAYDLLVDAGHGGPHGGAHALTETVFEAGGLLRASSAAALEAHLRREPGIHHVEANPVSQVVTVGYDEARIGPERIR